MSDLSTSIQTLSGGGESKQMDQNPENSKLVQDILNDLNGGGNQQRPPPPPQQVMPPPRDAIDPSYDTQYRQSQDRLGNQQFDVLHNYDNEYDSYIKEHSTTNNVVEDKAPIYEKIIQEIKDPAVIFMLVFLINMKQVNRLIRSNVLKLIKNDKHSSYGILIIKALVVSTSYFIIKKFAHNKI
jgi:hypothetical protein